ncbi:uncharacterized protein LOC134765016 [Penaeus indicus]|uniref:uncharacterized protein LOC134765016 n=1 Tax=Penaeus indicus TaxID=29960 RepID=UPI00300D334C
MESNGTSTTEATGGSDVHPHWRTAAFVVQLITCVFGVVGSCLSIYCVRLSKKMHKGMALQFYLLFITFFIICLIILLASMVDEYYTLIGWQEKHSVVDDFLHILVCFEHIVFGLIVVYRLMAVSFPVPFKILSRPGVVLTVELVLFLGFLALFLTEEHDLTNVKNPSEKSRKITVYFSIPFAVINFIYFIMLVVRTLKRRAAFEGEGPASLDSVSFAVGITILVNTPLDALHILAHFMSTDFVIVHVLYRLHFALVPLCFVVFNRLYRKEIKTRGLAWLQEQASRLPTFVSNAGRSST